MKDNDYPKVKCVLCGKIVDSYVKVKGKIVCDECGYEIENKMNKTKFKKDVKLDMGEIENIHNQTEEELDKDIDKLSKEQGWKDV